jgi:transcription termination/antitermination protein NusA
MNAEFIEALRQMEREKEISHETLMEALEIAFATAYKKSFALDYDVPLRIEQNTTKTGFKTYRKVTVVENGKVEHPHAQISQSEAQLDLKPNAQIGDRVEIAITDKEMEKMSRIAAQTAKQVLMQHIREKERNRVFEEFANRIGEIVSGVVSRFERGDMIVTVGKMDVTLPSKEQVPGERFRPNDRIKILILDVRRGTKGGMQVIASRTHPSLVRQLFEMEVPEIKDGIVSIKSIAREPGQRTKIAVQAVDDKVDAVGACVGQRGQRVQVVVQELGEEKIDIIRWNNDAKQLIIESLSPARVASVTLNEPEKSAFVVVPDNQLSLAIGRSGQNVRLAARLTGWRIDIRSESQVAKDGIPEPVVAVVAPAPAITKPIVAAISEPIMLSEEEENELPPITFGDMSEIDDDNDTIITFGDTP